MRPILIFLASALACQAASPRTPTFTARRDYYISLEAYVDVADTNADGIPDIITTNCGGALVLFGNGNGAFRQGPRSSNPDSPGCFAVAADMNGDGKADLVYAGCPIGGQVPCGVGISFGNGDGTFQPAVLYQAGTDTNIDWPVVGDFNGDGIPDAATIGESGVWVFLGQGGGVLGPGILTPFAAIGNGEIKAADFNGDGKLDLVATTRTGIAVFLGNGDGTFQSPQSITTPPPIGNIAVGDVNKDGYADIVVTRGTVQSSYVYLYMGSSTGVFSAPTEVYLPGGSEVAIADVNGDGNPDLVNGAVNIAFRSPARAA